MRNRLAIIVLQLGVVVVGLAVLPFKLFELDRYFVPKELVLHVAALAVAVLLVLRSRSLAIDVADALFAGFLTWSAASALFAGNHWLAQRALGISVSSAMIFWGARQLGASGFHRPLLIAAATATVCAAITVLAQAYGVETDYFSLNRAPGGTFGNRNFVAHFCAIGLPALIYATATARSARGPIPGYIGCTVVGAVLVLSRSRAAWLAIGASTVVVTLPVLASRKYWRDEGIGPRFTRLAFSTMIGGVLAVAIPNRLSWNSESPYLDSARGMVDYKSGSGRGRLAQYGNSMQMALANPVFGVGPGNWPVRYPAYASDNDRSLADDGMTANPWPSSDWVAFVSERGAIAALLLFGVFAALFIRGCRRWPDLHANGAVLAKVALIGTIPATLVVSAFDAALLLGAPAFLAWTIIGAASGVGRRGRSLKLSRRWWSVAVGASLLVLVSSVARSAAQTAAIATVGTGGQRAGWIRAATLDPGSYRINLRVAELYAGRGGGHCRDARAYTRRALDLFPHATGPKRVLHRCG